MQKAKKPSDVRDEPQIYPLSTRPTASNANAQSPSSQTDLKEERGDILCLGFYNNGQDTIFDICVTYADSPSYLNKSSVQTLENHEKRKRKKYQQACEDQRRSFVPLVMTTDGMLGEATKATVKRLAVLLSNKWNRPYSHVCGLVRSQLSVAIARASHLCIRGSRVSYRETSRQIQWEDLTGLELNQATCL